MSSKKVNLEQGSLEWLTWRRKGVGASDSSALFEVNPYKTTRDLWFEKAGFDEAEIDEGKEILFRIGHLMEEEARNLYLEKLGVEMIPACYEKEEIILASLDGENENEGILEVKYTGKDVVRKAKKGEIPIHHNIQVQQQLLVTGYDKAHYVCTNDGKEYVSVIIQSDLKLQDKIRTKVLEFWDLVESGKIPPLSDKDTLFITDADKRLLFRRLRDLYFEKKNIEAEYKSIERQIKDMATHPKISCAGVRVTTYEKKGSVQYKEIPELKSVNLDDYRSKPSFVKKITVGGE